MKGLGLQLLQIARIHSAGCCSGSRWGSCALRVQYLEFESLYMSVIQLVCHGIVSCFLLHIVLFVDGPHLKSVTLVTLQAVKLESDNVVFLFLAFESPLEDLMVLEDMVMDLVLEDPVGNPKGSGVASTGEFSTSHPVVVVVHTLGPL